MSKVPTYSEIYKSARNKLENCEIDNPNSEVMHMLWHCFGLGRAELIMRGSEIPNPEDYHNFLRILKKRCEGYPLQYCLGEWEFMGLNLNVGEGVLIPREDTSVLVEASLEKIKSIKDPKIIDLCSGSGCIALALESLIGGGAEIYAAEISEKAFNYLKKNCEKYDSDINLINDNIFNCYEKFDDEYFDLIISNPPYICSDNISCLQPEVHFEPTLALDGGDDGLEFYRKICRKWVPKLKFNGILAFEIGINQSEDVKNIMASNGIGSIEEFLDINNIPRAIIGEKHTDGV